MTQSFIRCDNLVKIYKVADLEVVALQGLELTVEAGEMLALIGPSGSGKSTLMNVLGGLDTPSAGKAFVGEQDLTEMTRADQVRYRRQTVGFIWQQTSFNLLTYLTARENVEMPMAFNGVKPGERRARAEQLLADVGLADRMDHRAPQLSGGQQQRTALAVAMANQPQLLLADEPPANVDPASADSVLDLILQACRDENISLLMVTHSLEVAGRFERVDRLEEINRAFAIQSQKV